MPLEPGDIIERYADGVGAKHRCKAKILGKMYENGEHRAIVEWSVDHGGSDTIIVRPVGDTDYIVFTPRGEWSVGIDGARLDKFLTEALR